MKVDRNKLKTIDISNYFHEMYAYKGSCNK